MARTMTKQILSGLVKFIKLEIIYPLLICLTIGFWLNIIYFHERLRLTSQPKYDSDCGMP